MKPTRKSRYRLESERVKELEKQRTKFKELSGKRFSKTNKSLPRSLYKKTKSIDSKPKNQKSVKEQINISLLWKLQVGLESLVKSVSKRKFIDIETLKEKTFNLIIVGKSLKKNLENKLIEEFLCKLEMTRLSHLSEYLQEEKVMLKLQKQKAETESVILRKKCNELERRHEWVLKEFKETEKDLKKKIENLEQENINTKREINTHEKLLEEMRKDIIEADKDFVKMGSIIQGLEDRLKDNFKKHAKQLAEVRSTCEKEKEELSQEFWKQMEIKKETEDIKLREEARIERAGIVVELQKMLKEK